MPFRANFQAVLASAVELVDSGATRAKAAAQIGVSDGALYKYIKATRPDLIQDPRSNSKVIQCAIALVEAGEQRKDAAAKAGISYSALWKHLRKTRPELLQSGPDPEILA